MIKQVLPYAKFLKDLCTMKRGLNFNKQAFLMEQVSAIIKCKTPIKYKDLGCPTISVNIGDTYIEKTLLDLGASVNLLPYSVYKQLGLRELKPTSITLSLANSSPSNMTLELNIFHLYKRHPNQVEDEQKEVCLIDTLIEEHVKGLMKKELEKTYEEFEENKVEEKLRKLMNLPPLIILCNGRKKEKPLPITNDEEAKKEESPKLNLKPLPNDLKYAYLDKISIQ
ncbi:hypothetical protein CK203_047282 [Vitis vinifera]|uniref:Aspartic peptidase DDI1-type domain-containing protein n=1 Tax=Vitis vinifera TaxID=29760 RepID=A0A438HZB2_VITVI|nr:hypothetical protein CK203_047282 [Vitis vinifera]